MTKIGLCLACLSLYETSGFAVTRDATMADSPRVKCGHCGEKRRVYGWFEQVTMKGGKEDEDEGGGRSVKVITETNTTITRKILDRVQVGDMVTCNDWDKPLRVVGVSQNYFAKRSRRNIRATNLQKGLSESAPTTGCLAAPADTDIKERRGLMNTLPSLNRERQNCHTAGRSI